MPTYAIGDVQGCYRELINLLDTINFDPIEDTLWFTGDLVNRGAQSLKVLRLVKSLEERAITVLGNHDLHLLAVAYGERPEKKQDTFQDVLDADDCEELCDWLRAKPLIHHDANSGYVLVHAGLPPQWNLKQALACAQEVEAILQSSQYPTFFEHMYDKAPVCWNDQLTGWKRLCLITNYLTRMRFCDAKGTLELTVKGKPNVQPPGFMPWFKIPTRQNKKLKILFGHWAALSGQTDEPNVHALDTGCVWGNALTAMRLEDGQRFSVPCAIHATGSPE